MPSPPGNSKQRRKTTKLVKGALQDLGVVVLRENGEGTPTPNNPSNPEATKKAKRSLVFTIFGIAFTVFLPGYFMIAAAHKFVVGLILLWCAPACFALVAVEYSRSRKAKFVWWMIFAAVSFALTIWAEGEWEKKVKKDVEMYLDMQMTVPHSGNAWKSIAHVANRSSWILENYQSACIVKQLRTASDQRFEVGLEVMWGDERLRIGGDSQNDKCLDGSSGGQFFSEDQPVLCADVRLSVKYVVDSWPEVRGQKQLRFVFDSGDWVQWPVERSASACY